MSNPELIKEELTEINKKALFCSDLDEALIGICHRYGQPPLAAYSIQKIIDIYMKRDGMTYEEAVEFYDFNVIDAWHGKMTPVFIDPVNE